jgi:hypothetical protein
MALGAAVPADAQQVFNDFRRNGTINPCNYTDGQLRQGLNGLPPDVQQYAPGLADQLAAGREGCGGGGGQPTAAVPTPAAPGAPPTAPTAVPAAPKIKIPAPPAPKATVRTKLANIATPTVPAKLATSESSGTPGWLLPLLVCLSLVGLLIAGVRIGGWSFERFTRPFKAGLAEAGGRTADALAQLRDSVRLGR